MGQPEKLYLGAGQDKELVIMSNLTANLGLTKPLENETADIAVINGNMDLIDKAVGDTTILKTAEGSGTVITLVLPSVTAYVDQYMLTFIAKAANGGAATSVNINGLGAKPLYKPNTAAAPNLIAGKAYTVWYDASESCFFIKASAEGTAVAENVLAGKTFSNDNDTGLQGAMVNNGPAAAETVNLTAQNQEYTIAAGFHNGLRKIKAVIAGLAASVIKAGTTVGGIAGTFTADATAADTNVLSGKTYYRNGVKGTGSIPVRTNTDTDGSYPQASADSVYDGQFYSMPPAGYYDGNVWVLRPIANLTAANTKAGVKIGSGAGGTITGTFTADANAIAGDIRKDKTAYVNGQKITGNIPVYGSESQNPATQTAYWSPGQSGNQYARVLHHTSYGLMDGSGAWFYSDQPDLLPQNIVPGKSIFGVSGTYNAYPVGSLISAAQLQMPLISVGTAVAHYSYLTGNMTNMYVVDSSTSSNYLYDLFRINPANGAKLASLVSQYGLYTACSKGNDVYFRRVIGNDSYTTCIFRYNTSLSKIFEVSLTNTYSGNDSVVSMDCDASGYVFDYVKSTCTTHPRGIERRDGTTGAVITTVYPNPGTDTAFLGVDSSGDVYVAFSTSTFGICRYNNTLATKAWSGIDASATIQAFYAEAPDLYVYNATSALLERRSKTDGSLLASVANRVLTINGHDDKYLYTYGMNNMLEVRDRLTLSVVASIKQPLGGDVISDGSNYIYLTDPNTGFCKYQRALQYQIIA